MKSLLAFSMLFGLLMLPGPSAQSLPPEPPPFPGRDVGNDDKGNDKGDEKEDEKPRKGDYSVGYPNPGQFHKAEEARIVRAIKAAGLNYKRIELSRCTIYCSARRAKRLVPMLKKVEATLTKHFPKSLSNASSPYSAHIVIVDGETEWANWVQACFDSYEKDGIKYSFGPGNENPRPMLTRGQGYVLPWLSVTRGDKKPQEVVSRFAAFSVGYLMMSQAGGPKAPDAMRTGFGDLSETIAHGTPSVMLTSYEQRKLQADKGWKALVKEKFEARKVAGTDTVWTYSTASMEVVHYAEAWSLVSTLAAKPDKFAKVVELVRTGKATPGEAIEQVYKLKKKDLLKAWYKFVAK